MGDDKGGAKVTGGVPPPGVQEYHRCDGDTWGGRVVVISPGGGSTGSRGTTPHNRVYKEAAGNHSGKGGMPTHL